METFMQTNDEDSNREISQKKLVTQAETWR
jgi:hypothetical protein